VFPKEFLARAGDTETGRVVVGREAIVRACAATRQAGQKSQLRERIAQFREGDPRPDRPCRGKQKETTLINRELLGVRELFQKNLIQINRLTSLERDAARLEGEHAQLIASVGREQGQDRRDRASDHPGRPDRPVGGRKRARRDPGKSSELVEKKVHGEDQLRRVDIRAPQDGVVHQLSVHTIGGVIKDGEPINADRA